MKYNFLLFAVLSLLCVKAEARIFGAWTGEKLELKEKESKDYYIYAMTTDESKRGFLSFKIVEGVYVPCLQAASLAADDCNKTKVYAVDTGDRQGKQYSLTTFNCYQLINNTIPEANGQYLNCNTNKYNSTVIRSDYGFDDKLSIIGTGNAHTSHFAIIDTEYGDGTFFIMFQRLESNNRLYLYGNGVGNQCGYWEKTGRKENQNNSWLFISEKQYKLRQEIGNKLDELESKIKNNSASKAEEAVYKKLVASENNTGMTIDQLESVDALIDASSTQDVTIEKLELEMAILDAQKKANAVADIIGIEPTYFTDSISAANQVLKNEKSIAKDYSNAKESLNSAVSSFNLDYHYYLTVLEQAKALGYTHNPSITGIANAQNQSGIVACAETLRTKAIEYVKPRHYPSGTDFSLFIVNNSFEAGYAVSGNVRTPHLVSLYANENSIEANKGWYAVGSKDSKGSDSNVFSKSDDGKDNTDIDGNYLFNTWEDTYNHGLSLQQKISGLPNGKYKVTAKLASARGNKTYLNIDLNGNKESNGVECAASSSGEKVFMSVEKTEINCTNNNDNTIIIRVEGGGVKNNSLMSYFRADDFRLIYLADNSSTFGKNPDGTADPAMADTNTEVQFQEGSYASAETREMTVSTAENPVWNTICLPYACTIPSEGVVVKQLTSVSLIAKETGSGESTSEEADIDDLQMNFSNVTDTMGAGKPYLIKITNENYKKLTQANVNVVNELAPTVVSCSVTNKDYTYSAAMIGTFVKIPLAIGTYFVRSGTDELWQVGKSGMTIKGYRAYFALEKNLSDTTSEPGNAAKLRMSFASDDEEEITSIDGVQVDSAPNGPVYDLTGRRISKPSKGIYIVNGKKYIRK